MPRTFADLKTDLIELLARTDITDDLAGAWINRAVDRVERVAEIPSMEAVVEATLTDAATVDIPSDYISLQDIYSDGYGLEKMSHSQLLQISETGPRPQYYCRLANTWMFRPAYPGMVVEYVYHAEWPDMEDPTDSNDLLAHAYELVLYTAAMYAAIYFVDSRKTEYEETARQLMDEVKEQHMNQELSGGTAQTLQSPYSVL